MSSDNPRVVAELGRPETPDEAAARKAESSRVYRSSQTFRNLIAALLATLAVMAVVIFAVPRGEPVATREVDVAAVAEVVASGYDRTVIVPEVPSSWRVNGASMSGDAEPAWTIVYVPQATGYLRISQGFDVDAQWESRVLSGASPDGVVNIAGIEWNRYEFSNPQTASSVSFALGTDAGTDRVLIYGSTDAATATVAAEGLADQIRALREEAQPEEAR